METLKLHRTLAIITIALLLFMFIDTFFTGTRSHIEIIKSAEAVTKRSAKSGSRLGESYYLYTTSQRRYEVPGGMYINLKTGDSFAVHKTSLLHSPIALVWRNEGFTYTEKNGVLNSNSFGPAVLIFGIASAIIILFFPTLIKRENINERVIVSAFSCTIVMFIVYLLQ